MTADSRRSRWSTILSFLVIDCGVFAMISVLMIASLQPDPSYALEAAHAQFIPHTPLYKHRSLNVGMPVHMSIPVVGLDLDIETGSYDATLGTWTLDDVHAFYADESVPANDGNGATILYGHNRRSVFSPLNNLRGGEELSLTTDNGIMFTYRLTSIQRISPTDTSIFSTDGSPRLLLLTCTGPWDSQRLLDQFTLMSEGKAS